MTSDIANPLWRDFDANPVVDQPLSGPEKVDLIVIGGGILGLSTALHAAEAGLSVRVVEADDIGARASGLNGGQVIPGLKYDPSALRKMFGEAQGERIAGFAGGTADKVFELIERRGLAVPRHRSGWIQAAHSKKAAEMAKAHASEWSKRGADVAALGESEVTALTGARGYVGGWIDRRAGTIQPLAYTRELARLAVEAGARLASRTRATRIVKQGAGWTVATSRGHDVIGRSVLVATNAYSDDLVPKLSRSIVTLHSFQIATAPLPSSLDAAILSGRQAVSDSRRILCYFRRSPDRRLVFGGRGSMAEPTSPRAFDHLVRAMRRVYPDIADVPVTHRWFGRVAMTLDHLPHIHEPEPGLLAAVGCQGRGIGLQTALGEAFSTAIVTGDRAALPLPITPIRAIPLHALRNVGVAAAIVLYRLLDGLEQ